MKRALIVLILALLMLGLTACDWTDSTPEEMHGFLDDIAGFFGDSQITDDDELIGRRTTTDDAYTGSYVASCSGCTGRDVIFGGGSILHRTLVVKGQINAASGLATVRIRMNDEVIELETDEDGRFETELNILSGGNYIMVNYSDFAGTVDLHSVYTGDAGRE